MQPAPLSGHPRVAATWIVSPFLRQVQPGVNEANSISSPSAPKHSNLAVVLFPQAPIPLTGYTTECSPFF